MTETPKSLENMLMQSGRLEDVLVTTIARGDVTRVPDEARCSYWLRERSSPNLNPGIRGGLSRRWTALSRSVRPSTFRFREGTNHRLRGQVFFLPPLHSSEDRKDTVSPEHEKRTQAMSRPTSKPILTAARLNDAILGCFAHVKPSETLDHLVRYLGTWSGSE